MTDDDAFDGFKGDPQNQELRDALEDGRRQARIIGLSDHIFLSSEYVTEDDGRQRLERARNGAQIEAFRRILEPPESEQEPVVVLEIRREQVKGRRRSEQAPTREVA